MSFLFKFERRLVAKPFLAALWHVREPSPHIAWVYITKTIRICVDPSGSALKATRIRLDPTGSDASLILQADGILGCVAAAGPFLGKTIAFAVFSNGTVVEPSRNRPTYCVFSHGTVWNRRGTVAEPSHLLCFYIFLEHSPFAYYNII